MEKWLCLLASCAIIVYVASGEDIKLDSRAALSEDADVGSSQCYLGLVQGKAHILTHQIPETHSAKLFETGTPNSEGHFGPVHDPPHGEVHFGPPHPQSASVSHYGKPQGDGLNHHHATDLGGPPDEPHFGPPEADPHHYHFGAPDGTTHGECHFSDPHGGVEGTCVIYGDPHIVGFDLGHTKDLSFLQDEGSQPSTGDVWLVKSPDVHIQGRFNIAGEKGTVFLKEVAVGGPFLDGNVLIIGGQESPIHLNGEDILSTLPSSFSRGCLIAATYHSDSVLVQDPTKRSLAPGVDIRLPQGVKILVNRGKNGLGLAITMPKTESQDGQCGNFNGDREDDTVELISGRIGLEIDSAELLFPHPFASLSSGRDEVDTPPETRFGPVHDPPHGEVHFGPPHPQSASVSHYGNPQGDGLNRHHPSDLGGPPDEPHFGPPEADPHHYHFGAPDGTTHGKCHFSDPHGGFDATEGTCVIFGDPHIVSFDESHTMSLNFLQLSGSMGGSNFESGDTWLVKSPSVHIQGRFNVAFHSKGWKGTFLKAIAVGGPFLQGNTLLVGDQHGHAFWNSEEILSSPPSQFRKSCLISADYHAESVLVQDLTKASLAPGVDIFLPNGVKLLINRGENGLGVSITMPKVAGQDGQCGNFNDFSGDDSVELISARIGTAITPSDLLFRHAFVDH